VRYNHLLAAALNLLFLWDMQTALLLERWKRRYGGRVAAWLEVIGEVEMLSCLATIACDHPDWVFPTFNSQTGSFSAKAMGHPLIDAGKRICNDLDLGTYGSVLIITGSNMSGKTTLLRTIGVNQVLAFAGAPVCAAQLQCSPTPLLTAMRITDDLERGISTFYAELLRIRTIVEAVQQHPALILIDEIFRGTNTHDRYAAAVHVLKHLAGRDAMTVISTHDLDLADLEESEGNSFRNFHFEDRYEDNAIHFDYKLRPGKSTASNALRLLELAGIIPKQR
jgi:DNA mismatch repair ATPase MutS